MSVLEEIRKLDEQKQKLLAQAKKEALQKAESAVKELNELGFNYRLVSDEPRSRRSGVRETILSAIAKNPNGISRQDLMDAVGMTDAKGKQAVSNAIAALKRTGKITGDSGHYKTV